MTIYYVLDLVIAVGIGVCLTVLAFEIRDARVKKRRNLERRARRADRKFQAAETRLREKLDKVNGRAQALSELPTAPIKFEVPPGTPDYDPTIKKYEGKEL